MKNTIKKENRERRHKRVRAKISGTAKVPRLCIFKSANHIYAQLIDDEKNKTLVEANDLKMKAPKDSIKSSQEEGKENIVRTKKALVAFEVGELIAQKAIEKKIEKVVFDRGGYQYHGRVKALAEGAREGGLKF